MSRKSIYIAILLAAGCGVKNYNVANPVLGPPPPRIKDAAARQMQAEAAQADADGSTATDSSVSSPAQVSQAVGSETAGLKTVVAEDVLGVQHASHEHKLPLEMTAVVARVNGHPVLAGDILEQYNGKLKEFEGKMKVGVANGVIDQATLDAKMRETQEMLIKRDLDHYVEQILMANAVRSKLKKDQLDEVYEQLATYFESEYVKNLKAKFEVGSTVELEGVLQSQGMSLETMRKMFIDQQLASQYVRTKMGEDPRPSRAELLKAYNAQLEKYSRPLQVKWQQLQINTNGPGGLAAATAKMEQAQADLRAGVTLDDVVKKYSDGALKENGGHWDWTQPESVANETLRKNLQKMKTGDISPVLTAGTSLQIVKVTARREAGHQPLEEVQEDLRQQIISEFRERRAVAVIADIRQKAIIETIFDDVPQTGEKAVER